MIISTSFWAGIKNNFYGQVNLFEFEGGGAHLDNKYENLFIYIII